MTAPQPDPALHPDPVMRPDTAPQPDHALDSPPGLHPGAAPQVPALSIRGLAKRFGGKIAVDGISLDVPAGSFYGIVGPNGAGKTTTLSMATGLLRPDFGTAAVHGVDVWQRPLEAKRLMGILPDGVRLFDRLTGEQLITYAGLLRGMDRETVATRVADLLAAMDLQEDAGTLVVDYSAGMTKKIALASALIHAPRLLVRTNPSKRWTRSPRPTSVPSLTATSPRAARSSCPATSWTWSSACATTWQ